MDYQKINEMLAKGTKKNSEISLADEYLLKGTKDKPEWMDGFLESNLCKLKETIYRAAAVAQGIPSLQGYQEGYFNEVIQNANDLHYGDTINIKTDVEVGERGKRIVLECSYCDKGFSVSNIYAFLNREMSDKTEDDSQTGKFGVGIKSFFNFADNMKVKSNVLFDFSIDRTETDIVVTGKAEINEHWHEDKSDNKTFLSICYNPEIKSEFNTEKLTSLIEYLHGTKDNIDVLNSFLNGSDSEIVFDIRALIFMQFNSKTKTSISKLNFKGDAHSISISCSEKIKTHTVEAADEDNQEKRWRIGVLQLKFDVDDNTRYEKDYIVFSNNSISSAFPVSEFSEENNRMYSTYYLKTVAEEHLLPIGMLVDSKYANIHRNDVGDSEEKIEKVYKEIREYMKNLYAFMCSPEVAASSCAVAVSDVFHNIIARYLMADGRHDETPLTEGYLNNSSLPKKKSDSARAYVVVHNSNEAYDNATFKEGDIIQKLRDNYFSFIEKENAYDLKELLSSTDCICGVRKAYELISSRDIEVPDEKRWTASQIINFFSSVGDYLAYEISGERRKDRLVSDAEIDDWLLRVKEAACENFDAEMFLKLVGRYKLNNAIGYDGRIIKDRLSFKDYLFNGRLASGTGLLAKYQNEFYDKKYEKIKKELLSKRYIDPGNKENPYMIRCIYPVGKSRSRWSDTYDYYGMVSPQNADKKLSEPLLLLERMAEDDKFTGLCRNQGKLLLFEHFAVKMEQREYMFVHYNIVEQQIIELSCIENIRFDSFVDFINAVKYKCMLYIGLQAYIHLSCQAETISTSDIVKNVLPVMIETPEGENKEILLDKFSPSEVMLVNIHEDSNNEMPAKNVEFVSKITGYRVHLYRFDSGTRRRIIAYFGNGRCAVKTAASKKYREVAEYNKEDKNIYIFYDNISDNTQQAVSEVMGEIGIDARELELLDGYIHNGNATKTMSYISRRRNLNLKVKKKLILEWADMGKKKLPSIYDTEILYRLLTARGSYDIFCPICSDIPLETFDYGEDTNKKHSRKIILMENENPETSMEIPYIITVGCSYCCQRLRSTLIKSEFDGKNIVLTTQLAHGLHEKTRSKQQIELSPINIEVMKRFKIN